MLGGLIAGALKGAAEGYSTYAKGELENKQKLDYATKILEMQTEKDLRVDEIKRDRDIATKKREIEELDPLKTASDVNRTTKVGAAETGVLADRERNLAPIKLENEVKRTKQVGEVETGVLADREGKVSAARGAAERANLGAYAGDAKAREGVRAKARDQHIESAASAAQAKLFSYQLDQTKLTDEEKRKARQFGINYFRAIDANDTEAANKARYDAMALGVDPAATKKGSLKVTEDETGAKQLVHEDDKGNITRVDTSNLPSYKPRGAAAGQNLPAPKTRADLDKLPSGTRYTAPDGTTRIKQ